MPCVHPQEQTEAVFGREDVLLEALTRQTVGPLRALGGYTVTDIADAACSAPRLQATMEMWYSPVPRGSAI
ncbi:hypothetical protein MINTM006_52650 [Mycobacterium intracellulare]|nr:hypothetical protein MINTM006_52650 [Mycobacterium intracellulare]BCP28952.1 hypothetical protein MINTM025_53080 [Mycobacterium intracellulare]